MAWFSTATKHFSKAAGSKTLHPVVDLNSAERFKPFSIVKRKTSFWPWRSPKIVPTQLHLNDILLEAVVVPTSASVIIKDYSDSPQLKVDGDLGAKLATELNLDVSTIDSFSMVAEFGDIVKTEINWQTLQNQLETSRIDFQHEFIQELQGKKRTSLCIVLESLANKKDCMLSGSTDERVSSDDSVDILKSPVTINAHAKGSVEIISKQSFEISPGTVLAFSCNILEIKSDGSITLHAGSDRIDSSSDDGVPDSDPDAVIKSLKSETDTFMNSADVNQIRSLFACLLDSSCISELLEIIAGAVADIEDGKEYVHVLPADRFKKCCTDSSETCVSFLKSVGFKLTTTDNKSHFNFSSKDASLLQSCWAMLECLEGLSLTQRKQLKQLSNTDQVIVLRMVESGLRGTKSFAATGSFDVVNTWQESNLDLIKSLGFTIYAKSIEYKWSKSDQLNDTYVVLSSILTA